MPPLEPLLTPPPEPTPNAEALARAERWLAALLERGERSASAEAGELFAPRPGERVSLDVE